MKFFSLQIIKNHKTDKNKKSNIQNVQKKLIHSNGYHKLVWKKYSKKLFFKLFIIFM